ncbi:hypothetical protein LTR37_016264 [Vermiconidia calcicola]|uniref:Uncharacterized protein n=1 Tax=Vermiconidia calcicola TaxID=1690605 RepID=A0ACC3MNI7_9PEZI|nr:hypothetical protein LTR37_016264 [Vermiconidia calcicola]
MGFTAINETDSGQWPASNPASSSNTGPEIPQSVNTSTAQQRQRRSVASEYLGRGELNELAPANDSARKALRGQGTKTTGNKGKKRASTSGTAANAKRRKISDVSDGMGVTKASSSKAKESNPPAVSAKRSGTRKDGQPSKEISEEQVEAATLHHTAQSASVLIPATSMDVINTSSQQTSLDALKASKGHGMTLYGGYPTSSSHHSGSSYTQPLLNQQGVRNEHPGAAANTRELRPRKGPMEQPGEPSRRHEEGIASQQPQNNNINPDTGAPKPQWRTAFPSKNQRQQLTRRTSTRASEEDFIGDDDCVAEALELANTVEERSTAQSEAAISSKQMQLPSPASSNKLRDSRKKPKSKKRKPTPILTPNEGFIDIDDADEADMIDLTNAAEEPVALRPPTPPPRERKLNMREVDKHEDYGGALLSEAEKQLLKDIKATNNPDAPKPIVRKPFSNPILDRSPIFGASNITTLRTCFRIGEALKEGCQAVRMNKNVIIELYARVTSSWREPKPGRKQHFVLEDLYHDHPPHLEGSFELWEQSRLWELDSKVFLQPRQGGIMCRAVARMRRDRMKWKLEVLSIWEASWEDVEHVAGIYAKDPEFDDE